MDKYREFYSTLDTSKVYIVCVRNDIGIHTCATTEDLNEANSFVHNFNRKNPILNDYAFIKETTKIIRSSKNLEAIYEFLRKERKGSEVAIKRLEEMDTNELYERAESFKLHMSKA